MQNTMQPAATKNGHRSEQQCSLMLISQDNKGLTSTTYREAACPWLKVYVLAMCLTGQQGSNSTSAVLEYPMQSVTARRPSFGRDQANAKKAL